MKKKQITYQKPFLSIWHQLNIYIDIPAVLPKKRNKTIKNTMETYIFFGSRPLQDSVLQGHRRYIDIQQVFAHYFICCVTYKYISVYFTFAVSSVIRLSWKLCSLILSLSLKLTQLFYSKPFLASFFSWCCKVINSGLYKIQQVQLLLYFYPKVRQSIPLPYYHRSK